MKVLVVDDDPELLPLIAFALRNAGLLVLECESGEDALVVEERERPDLFVLDVNLPGIDGFTVCRTLRKGGRRVPILMLTVRGDEEDLVRGLDEGADDFLTKPFSPRTLSARVRALLRRSGERDDGGGSAAERGTPGVVLDGEARTLRLPGRPLIRLTELEFRLIQLLHAHAGAAVRTDAILRHVWGSRSYTDRQHLKQLVHRLRQKLEDDPTNPRALVTEPGVGYRLVMD